MCCGKPKPNRANKARSRLRKVTKPKMEAKSEIPNDSGAKELVEK